MVKPGRPDTAVLLTIAHDWGCRRHKPAADLKALPVSTPYPPSIELPSSLLLGSRDSSYAGNQCQEIGKFTMS